MIPGRNCENINTPNQPFLPFGSYTCYMGSGETRGLDVLKECMKVVPAYFAFPAFNIPGVDPVGIPVANWYSIWWVQAADARVKAVNHQAVTKL